MNHPLKIAVLMGGFSSEREVSLQSGTAIADALESLGHEVRRLDVRDKELSCLNGYEPDVVFIALHGKFGEDGGAQAVLEARGIPYTGSGVVASNLAMNKAASKEVFIMHGIPTPDYVGITSSSPTDVIISLVKRFGLPAVAKPVAEGSSVGVSIVRKEEEIPQALERVFSFGENAIVEKYIPGREITVGILDDEPLPIIELATKREFYDYNAKYHDDDTEYRLDIDIDEATYRHVQDVALGAHRALGCYGMSRVDMRLDPDGNPFVLEVNTIPGFTSHSLLPKAAAAVGIDFPHLCERIVELALAAVRTEA